MGKLRWIIIGIVLAGVIGNAGFAQRLDKKAIASEMSRYLDRALSDPDSGFVEQAWQLAQAWKEQVMRDKMGNIPQSQLPEFDLPESAIVLEWFVSDSILYLFSSAQSEVVGYRMGPETKWAELLNAFRAACLPAADTLGSEKAFTQIASSVYQKFLKPVLPVPQLVRNPIMAALADKNLPLLILIPDETLKMVPLDLALTQSEYIQGRGFHSMPYLFRSYDIRYQSSLKPYESDSTPAIRHRWNSPATADFEEGYQERLDLDIESGEALYQTRENWLRSGNAIHPAHWGALSLWEQKIDPVSYTGILWGILGGIFLGLGVFVYRWRFGKISGGPIPQK